MDALFQLWDSMSSVFMEVVLPLILLGLVFVSKLALVALVVGVGLLMFDYISGPRARVFWRNNSRGPDGWVNFYEEGFLFDRGWFVQLKAAAALAVLATLLWILFWKQSTPAEAGWYPLIKQYAAYLQYTAEIGLGLFLGFFLAPYFGKALMGSRWIVTFGARFDWYSRVPLLGWSLKKLRAIYDWVYERGHEGLNRTEEEIAAQAQALVHERERTAVYWLAKNASVAVVSFFKKQWYIRIPALLMFLVVTRGVWQSWLVGGINNILLFVLLLVVGGILRYLVYPAGKSVAQRLSGNEVVGRVVGVFLVALSALGAFNVAERADYYARLNFQYKAMQSRLVLIQSDKLPVSDTPRFLPLGVVQTGLDGAVDRNIYRASSPAYVSLKGDGVWTSLIQPASIWNRATTTANSGMVLGGQSVALIKESMQSTCFRAFGSGLFDRGATGSANRSIPLLRALNHKARSEQRLMVDDSGAFVLVIPIDRYVGFPRRKEFGGVHVIPQCSDVWYSFFKRVFVGEGYYVSPEEIQKGTYAFLKGNSLVSEDTMRRYAESMRFHRGMRAVFSNNVEGDVRIPDRADIERNRMPHVGSWKMSGDDKSALYGHLLLELAGASTAAYDMWVPADGRSSIYVLDARDGGAKSGVTGVPGTIKNRLADSDWRNREPVEVTAFNHVLDGKVRQLQIARMALIDGDETNAKLSYDNLPQLVVRDRLTGATHRLFSPADPSTWDAELLEVFKPMWESAAPPK